MNGSTVDIKQADADWDNAGEAPMACKVKGPDGLGYTLYTGFVFSDGRKLAPAGWRIPTPEESEALVAACFANGELTAAGKEFLGSTAMIGYRQNEGQFIESGKVVSWWVDAGAPSFMPGHTFQLRVSDKTMETMIISARDEGHSIRLVRD